MIIKNFIKQFKLESKQNIKLSIMIYQNLYKIVIKKIKSIIDNKNIIKKCLTFIYENNGKIILKIY
jgi:hypothetical protein